MILSQKKSWLNNPKTICEKVRYFVIGVKNGHAKCPGLYPGSVFANFLMSAIIIKVYEVKSSRK
jgi:hypothetical protein